MARQTPTTIFFDLDETLIENRRAVPELFQDVYNLHAQTLGEEHRGDFFARLRHYAGSLWDSMFDHSASPESLFVECFANAARDLKLLQGAQATALGQTMLDSYVTLSSGNVSFQPHAEDTLENLRELGLTVGIITNGIEQIQLGKINALGLTDKVDVITVSAQARAHKPHAPVFELALERANAKAEHAWQIGDHATNDVAGAIRAGMGGVFYDPGLDRRASAFDELPEQPTHVISALNEVLDLVGN